MKESTKEKFRQELSRKIGDLCSKSKKLYFDKDKFELVFVYYYEYENRVRNAMNLSMNFDEDDVKMDIHKVAASFLCSILKAKPIGYKADGIIPTFLERTANEQLGIGFGLYIIDVFNKSKSDVTPLEMEVYGLKIKTPECKEHSDIDYTTHFAKLIFDKKVKKELDFTEKKFNITLIFFISQIYFLIDSFSYYKNMLCLKDDKKV